MGQRAENNGLIGEGSKRGNGEKGPPSPSPNKEEGPPAPTCLVGERVQRRLGRGHAHLVEELALRRAAHAQVPLLDRLVGALPEQRVAAARVGPHLKAGEMREAGSREQ